MAGDPAKRGPVKRGLTVLVLSVFLFHHVDDTQIISLITNNLRGDDNFNIAMNRMKAADITQLRYLLEMYVYFITIILLKPRIYFLVPVISGKKYGTKGYNQ